MTLSVWQVLLLVAGTALLVWGLHALAWRLLHVLISAVDRLPLLRQTRAWARVRPLQAWLRLRHPRLHAILAARLRPKPFTGLPLTLLVSGAFYVAALLGGLTGEVLEAGAVLRFDQAVNAAFGAWRVRDLVAWTPVASGTGPALGGSGLTSDAHLAIQAEPAPPSSHSEAETQGHELARV